MRVHFLGTGTSHGIPMIACDCAVCTSDDPRDRRTRPSVLVEYAGRNVLIDTTPELRLQCIALGIRRVDAVLFTHAHADHVVGLDDLRRFHEGQSSALPCYADRDTLARLAQMFDYAFREDPDYVSAKPTLQAVEVTGPFELFGRTVVPLHLPHGPTRVLGFRFGRFAYCTDCNDIPPAALANLRDLDLLVLDALRIRSHPTHLNLQQAIEWAARIAAGRTLFTHIAHELMHAKVQAQLPAAMALAYDGLVVELPD